MKVIKGFLVFNRKVFFVVTALIALSLCSPPAGAYRAINANNKAGMQLFCDYLPGSDWKFAKTVDNVDFYYKISDCKGSNAVFLKFNNKNNYGVQISWREVFVTKQVASKKEGVQGEKKLSLLPGETISSDCGDTNARDSECAILPKDALPAYKADILQFEFKDISVNPVK